MRKTINDDEIKKLLYYANKNGLRDFTMIFLALSTGLRVAELVGLFIEDVAPFGEVSTILSVPSRVGKNGKKRDIPINEETRKVLSSFIQSKKDFNHPVNLDSYLFCSSRSHFSLSPRDFQRIVKDLSSTAINRGITPHTLRHTFATRLLKHTNLRVVQELLGHANVQTTQIYTHVSMEDVQPVIENLNLPLVGK
ncbi:Tyrosine recombinase XerD [subsurface metagenome]